MKKDVATTTTVLVLFGVAMPSASVGAQETGQQIAYTRGTGVLRGSRERLLPVPT